MYCCICLLLKEEVLEAWGLNKDEPLIIRLHLSMTSYLDPPSKYKYSGVHQSAMWSAAP